MVRPCISLAIASLMVAGCDKIAEVATSVKESAEQAVAEQRAEPETGTVANADTPSTPTPPPAQSSPSTPLSPSLIPSALRPRDPLAALKKLREPTEAPLTDDVIIEASEADESQRRQLKELQIIVGAISEKGIRALEKFPELTSIKFAGAPVHPSLIEPLQNLSSLTYLGLATSGADNAALAALSHQNLTHLDLTSSQVNNDGLGFLDRLPALAHLSLDYCPIDGTGFEDHPQLLKLESFACQSTEVLKNGLPTIMNMKKLRALRLNNTHINDNTFPDKRTIWPELELLHVMSSSLTDKGTKFLSNHKSLQDVDLSRSVIGNPTLGYLRFAKDLRRLRIVETSADDRGITALKKLIKGLEVITE